MTSQRRTFVAAILRNLCKRGYSLKMLKTFLILYWQLAIWIVLLEHCIDTLRLVSLKFSYCIINLKACEFVTITSTYIKTLDGKLGLRVQKENDWWWWQLAQHNMSTEYKMEIDFKHSELFVKSFICTKQLRFTCHRKTRGKNKYRSVAI